MIRLTISEWTNPPIDLAADMKAIGRWTPKWQPIGARVKKEVIKANKKARLAGIGADGKPLQAIHPNTVKRRRRRGAGNGPPMVPNLAKSRPIAGVDPLVTFKDKQMNVQVFVWTGGFLNFHLQPVMMGGTLRPIRDVLGISEDEWKKIHKIVADEIMGQFMRRPSFQRYVKGVLGQIFGGDI